MTRLACALQLAALGVLVLFLADPSGPTATAFSFLGMPLVGVSMLLYVLTLMRRRSGRTRTRGEGRLG